mmetsp:Transcript_3032/g.9059  ORF Transcript_3032/g.9059 Transcript_3032/m.9059 type:complete len:161 (-) Transcript_3032:52-534(-)
MLSPRGPNTRRIHSDRRRIHPRRTRFDEFLPGRPHADSAGPEARHTSAQLSSTLPAPAPAADATAMSARERLAAQDAQLERLGAGVDRIRNLGETMHDETRQQLGLLDQLEGDVDKTTSGIREETKHAEDVAVSGQTFYMYVCIAILILVMVLELIIGLQ